MKRREMRGLLTFAVVLSACVVLQRGLCATVDRESGFSPRTILLAEACSTNGFVKGERVVADAVAAAGFLPLVVPKMADQRLVDEAVDRADGLVIWGSIPDAPFGPRTEFEKRLILRAAKQHKPVLGFCHGCQAINICFGGSCRMNPKDAKVKVVHCGKEHPYVKDYFHSVEVKTGSLLAAAIGDGEQTVNTSHNFCIDKLGEGFEPTALAPDGVIEAIEHRTLPIVGLQFHPERIAPRDPRFLKLIGMALGRRTGARGWQVSEEESRGTPAEMVRATQKVCPDNEIAAREVPDDLQLFLLIGQSNMAGRGTLTDDDRRPIDLCYKLGRDDEWKLATSPLHFDRDTAGYGPANRFVRRYLADHPGKSVGLIPCAVGGSSSATWSPERGNGVVAENYKNAIRRARIARKKGTIVGVLWHQGEADRMRCEKDGEYYPLRLAAMVEELRRELGQDGVPFVLGEIGNLPHHDCATMNPLIRRAAALIPDSALVSAEDLTGHLPDGIHFDTPGYSVLGDRYYEAWHGLSACRQ